MRLLLLVTALWINVSVSAQEINIIPKPQQLEIKKGNFIISPATVILLADANEKATAAFFNQHLKTYYGFQLKTAKSASRNFIKLSTKKFIKAGIEGKYDLHVAANSIEISGDTYSGTFNGMQTLIQLLPIENIKTNSQNYKLSINHLSIQDKPRFQYRGMHLDVGRHFFPISYVKRYIDFLAYHKLNIFHWHLTEDQGWRVEIKKYPLLTTIGSKRNGTIIGRYPGKGNDEIQYDGFYTQAEIKEVVAYAKERFIEVIPEIEMPGHSSAAIAAYPWLSCFSEKPTAIPANMISKKSIEEQKNGRIKLVQETWGVFDDVFCAGNDSTFTFLQNVIDEVIALFPSEYFHIGGDESPKTHWKICNKCQQRMKELKLKDEHELQSYFVQRMEKYLNSKGKILIGWDEILEGGLAPNAQVMSWRGEAGGIEAAKQKHFVIMSPGKPVYFDHTQSKNEDSVTIGGYNSIEAVYAYDPVPKELSIDEQQYVRGAQANVWTEYIKNTSKVEYMIFPRMAALSEVLWSEKPAEPNGENKNRDDFEKRLMVQMKRYEMMKWNYSKAYFELTSTTLPVDNFSGIIWEVKSKMKELIFVTTIPNGFDSLNKKYKVLAQEKGVSKLLISKSEKHTVQLNKTNITLSQTFSFSKSTGKKITLTTPPSNSYPGDGAFTLVNGIINEKGLLRSHEFIGFSGTDCEAIIDLGNQDTISTVTAHVFSQPSSWIWPPSSITVQISTDGINFIPVSGGGSPLLSDMSKLQLSFSYVAARYVKVFLMNKGIIPQGNAGAGNKAWLFVSEMQIQ